MVATVKSARETVEALGARFFPSPTMQATCAAILYNAVEFRFGAIQPDEAHQAFAADLIGRGLFRLPFPETAISCVLPLSKHHAQVEDWELLVCLHQMENGSIGSIIFVQSEDMCAPYFAQFGARLVQKQGELGIDYQAFTRILPKSIRTSESSEQDEMIASYMTAQALGYVVMLMSKGVALQHFPASERLNKAREKRGKQPIRDRYVVSINTEHLRLIHTEGGGLEDITGHTRGSPRMHWRRGHFRVLNQGEEGERIVPVAPSLVGANERAADIRAKAYAVRG